MDVGPRFRHVPAGAQERTPPSRRFPYTSLVFVGYAVVMPLVAAGAAWVYNRLGAGDLLVRTQAGDRLPHAPSWQNLLFGAGAPELALAGGLVGLLLWRRVWAGDEPDLGPDLVRGALWGALLSLLLIPFGIFGLFLRTCPKEIPLMVRPFFALFVAGAGSLYSLLLPWTWGTACIVGALLGSISAAVACYLKSSGVGR
jgi:hypothetical protein